MAEFTKQYLLRETGAVLTDSELPVENKRGLFFISSERRRKAFYKMQWLFTPLEIHTSPGPDVQVQEVHEERRLPWENSWTNIASGAYGEIDKIQVSKGCLKGHVANSVSF